MDKSEAMVSASDMAGASTKTTFFSLSEIFDEVRADATNAFAHPVRDGMEIFLSGIPIALENTDLKYSIAFIIQLV
jgi:hypothetical protein